MEDVTLIFAVVGTGGKHMRTVDADELLKSVRESAKRAEEWLADCKAYHSAMTARAEQAILTFNECALRIKNSPTVDAVPVVHGRWIDIDSEMYTWKIRCSKCGHERSMMSTGQTYPMYCEDCGTRMDGKDDDHEKAD